MLTMESLEFVMAKFFLDFVGTHISWGYILNEIISKIFIEHINEKRNGMQHSL